VDPAGVFLCMTREKRSEIIRSRVTPSMLEQIELDLRETSNVLSLSDWLFEAAEERLAKRAVRVERQKLSRRMGNQ
jgi:hypothetical protein